MKNLSSLMILFFLIWSHKSFAVDEDFQQWVNLTAQGSLSDSKKLNLYAEVQMRRSNDQSKVYETLLRPALFFKTDDYGAYYLGYLKRYSGESKDVESRLWVQWLNNYNYEPISLTARLRFEQRDLVGVNDNLNRMRAMLRVNHLTMISEGLKPFVASELFYNFNTVSSDLKSGLSQSRTGIGLSKTLSSAFVLDVGYLNVYIKNYTKADQSYHVLNTVLNYAF